MKKNKNIILWEAKETDLGNDNNFKKCLKNFLTKLSKYSGLIEPLILLIIYGIIGESWKYSFIIFILSIVLFIRTIIRYIKIYKSKLIIMNEEQNKRVIGHEGAQGSGKTSFMFYTCYVMKKPVFTSAPAKINGEYTYKLTNDILNLNVKIPYNSVVVLDEISLYLDNSKSKDYANRIETEGLEYHMQLIRHCYDGQMLTASVDMNRVCKRIEEKHGMFRRMLKQECYNCSIIIDPIIKIISRIFKLDIKTGYRIWNYQTFEVINHEGYIFDLSNDTENTKNNKYANLNKIWSFSANSSFEYDDRYFKNLYIDLPKAELKKWTSLNFDFEELKDTGFNDVTKFFNKKYKNNINEVGDNNA